MTLSHREIRVDPAPQRHAFKRALTTIAEIIEEIRTNFNPPGIRDGRARPHRRRRPCAAPPPAEHGGEGGLSGRDRRRRRGRDRPDDGARRPAFRMRRARSRDARPRRPRRARPHARGRLAIPVIVQTAHGGIDIVVSAMRAGAIDFVVKPVGAERLLVSLRNAMATRALEGELARMKRSRGGTLSFKDIITRSAKMRAVLQRRAEERGLGHPGAGRGRVRRRQGVDRAGDPRLGRAQGQALRRGQLRRAAGEPRRIRSCSATRRAPSPAPPSATTANSSRPRAARCSSTRSANCRRRPRSSCCARSRKARSSRSAASARSRSMSG